MPPGSFMWRSMRSAMRAGYRRRSNTAPYLSMVSLFVGQRLLFIRSSSPSQMAVNPAVLPRTQLRYIRVSFFCGMIDEAGARKPPGFPPRVGSISLTAHWSQHQFLGDARQVHHRGHGSGGRRIDLRKFLRSDRRPSDCRIQHQSRGQLAGHLAINPE